MDEVTQWVAGNMLALASTSLGVAVLLILVLLLRPNTKEVPLYRRRPGVVAQRSALAGVADATTRGVDRLLARRNLTIAERLDVAGIKTPASQLVVLIICALIVVWAFALLLGRPGLAVLLTAAIPFGVVAWVTVKTSKRRAAFGVQLDETAQMIAGSLRSGYSFTQALTTIGREAESPTSEEFTRMSNELRVGRPIYETMEHTAARMQSEDFSWIAQAVAINREVGGNLADVLEGVSHTIRERAQLRRQVQALSAEGRLSALVLGALPFGLVAMLSVMNPTYLNQLFTHPIGWLLLFVGVVLLTVGGLWLRKTVQIKF